MLGGGWQKAIARCVITMTSCGKTSPLTLHKCFALRYKVTSEVTGKLHLCYGPLDFPSSSPLACF